jgi:hypothetical protein
MTEMLSRDEMDLGVPLDLGVEIGYGEGRWLSDSPRRPSHAG